MDRKSFFKKALLAIGSAIVPNAILKAIPKEKEIQYGFKSFEVDSSAYRDGELTLYHQTMIDFLRNHPSNAVNAKKFYWAEYESEGDEFGIIQGLNPPPTPIKFTLNKNISV